MTVRYGLVLNEFADRTVVGAAVDAQFDLLAVKADSAAASCAAAECGSGALAGLLFYELLDRGVSRILPDESARIRLEYLSCLNEKLHGAKRCGGEKAELFFDWEKAAGDEKYYRNCLQIMHGCSGILSEEKLKAVVQMRMPVREVPLAFFRKLLLDCGSTNFELAVNFHIHEPAVESIDWDKELSGMIFPCRTVFVSYEPKLGNFPNTSVIAGLLRRLDRFRLSTGVYFAPGNLDSPQLFEEEIERLQSAVTELKGKLKSC